MAPGGCITFGPADTSEVKGHRVLLRSGSQLLVLTFLEDGVVRCRHLLSGEEPETHSFALTGPPSPGRAPVRQHGNGWEDLRGSHLVLRHHHDPFALEVLDAGGRHVLRTMPGNAITASGRDRRLRLALPHGQHVYGFGEKTGGLDKRGAVLTMWNTDEPFYDVTTDPLYKSVPFWIGLVHGRAHGVFLDNPGRAVFDVGAGMPDVLEARLATGALDLYLIPGPHPHDVVRRYTALTGRPPAPPLWALGFQQSRYSYYPDSRVREVARELRTRRIPCDVIYLDIHHLDAYRPFTWHPGRFPDPEALLEELHAAGFHVIGIVDPGLPVSEDHPPYLQGRTGGHFVQLPDGRELHGRVWPGTCAFPDFLRRETREWWGDLYRSLLAVGMDGFWNDMNEPALQDRPDGTMPGGAVHRGDAGRVPHREVHNVYGSMMVRATREGVARLRPGHRPFVLTRSAYAGTQRFGATWSGDNRSRFEDLRLSIPMTLNMGVCGFPLHGPDIGGYAGQASPELLTRWLQAGAFLGLMRVHTSTDTGDQEPWSHGPPWTDRNRSAIELRYRLLPYLYSLFHEAARTGVPPARPLWMEHPGEEEVACVEDQILLGSHLLVAPVMEEGAALRPVRLPRGTWYAFGDGHRHRGGRVVCADGSLDSGRVPLFARAGALIPWGAARQHTGEPPGPVLTVHAFAGAGAFILAEDAGDGPACGPDPCRRTRLTLQPSPDGRTLALEAELLEAGREGHARHLRIRLHGLPDRPSALRRRGRPESPARRSPPDASDPSGGCWDGEAFEVWLDTDSLPQTLEVDAPGGLLRDPDPPVLGLAPAERCGDLPRRIPARARALPLLAEGPQHLRWHRFWPQRPMRLRAGGFSAPAGTVLWVLLEEPEGRDLQPTANHQEADGLRLRWHHGGGRQLRITPSEEPGGPPDIRGLPPATGGVEAVRLHAGPRILYALHMDPEVLDPASLGGRGLPFDLEVVHSDAGGFRTHMAWTQALEGEGPGGLLRRTSRESSRVRNAPGV